MEKRVVVTMLVMMAFFMVVNYTYPILFPPAPMAQAPTERKAPLLDRGQGRSSGQEAAGSDRPASTGQDETFQAGLPEDEERAEEPPLPPARDIIVTTPEMRAVFTEEGARLKSLTLSGYKAYRIDPGTAESQQELVGRPEGPNDLSLGLRIYDRDGQYEDLSGFRFQADKSQLDIGPGQTGAVVFSGQDKHGLLLEKTVTFRAGSYAISQDIRARNNGNRPLEGRLGMTIAAAPYSLQQSRYNAVSGYLNRSFFSEDIDDAGKALSALKLSTASWLGYMDQYFLTAFILSPRGEMPPGQEQQSNLDLGAFELRGRGVRLSAAWPLNLYSGTTSRFRFDVYFGPKAEEALAEAGSDLTRSVDLGWFSFLSRPLGWLLKMFYGLVGNYGVAIIIVTVIIKIVLWPLTAKSYKSMKEMQKLQPRIQKLREKHKGDREAMNREMMELYRTFKVSPLSGCLPMLLQIPFFIAFYRLLDYTLELRGAPFVLWIKDLSAPDRLFHFDISLPLLNQPTGIPVLTLIMGATMIWQQKMTPQMGDPMQAKIMMFMPVIFIVALLNMPAGLVLYWLVNNILSIAQQKLINRPAKPPLASNPQGRSSGSGQAKSA
jgi:YidC/Oxa1 family membrane protein insertase